MSTVTEAPLPHDGDASAAVQSLSSLEIFMAQAIGMENEAAQRYDELADAMEIHNNVEVTKLFRTMADIERKHAASLLAQMGWASAPPAPAASWQGPGQEGPETVASDDVHYLMQPYHALQIALHNEERAARFFRELAARATSGPVREAALTLEREEQEHVILVQAWMARVPRPEADWAEDPDPPRYTD